MPLSGTRFQELQSLSRQASSYPHSHHSLRQATKGLMMDTVCFLVYRWPYLCHTSPEGLSVGQTTGAAITTWLGLGLWTVGMLSSSCRS